MTYTRIFIFIFNDNKNLKFMKSCKRERDLGEISHLYIYIDDYKYITVIIYRPRLFEY